MMQVRDKTLAKTDYKGRPFDAAYEDCPCRFCSNCHDCGRYEYYYEDGRQHIRWKTVMRCATRENGGCEGKKIEPVHLLKGTRGHKCQRCGLWINRATAKFTIIVLLLFFLGLLQATKPLQAGAEPTYHSYLPAIQSDGAIVSGRLSVDEPVVDASLYLGQWLKDEKGRWSGVAFDRLGSPRSWTDEEGNFMFVGVSAGRYSLVLDTITNAYLLNDPITGGALFVDVAPNGLYSLGCLVYESLPIREKNE